jgi:hypothetical protein
MVKINFIGLQASTNLTATALVLVILFLAAYSPLCLSEQTTPSGRVVYGNETRESRPEIAMLLYQGSSSKYLGCAGTLIDKNKIVTAAHCVDDRIPAEVVLGRHSASQKNGTSHSIESIIIHPGFNVTSLKNDIAIITLSEASNIPPAKLATKETYESLQANQELQLFGWGYTSPYFSQPSDTLQQASVKLISSNVCNSEAVYSGLIGVGMMCAGHLQGGADSCAGDSGGPLLVTNSEGNTLLIGIVSWGSSKSCGSPNRPGVYTNVSAYSSWLYEELNFQDPLFKILHGNLAKKTTLSKNSLRGTALKGVGIGIADMNRNGTPELVSVLGRKVFLNEEKSRRTWIHLKRKGGIFHLLDVNNDGFQDLIRIKNSKIEVYYPNRLKPKKSKPLYLTNKSKILDSKVGHIQGLLTQELIILTPETVEVIHIIPTALLTVASFANTRGGSALLVGNSSSTLPDTVYLLEQDSFKPLRYGIGTSSLETIQAPENTFFWDVDNDGRKELLTTLKQDNGSHQILVSKSNISGFGPFIPWFDVPKGLDLRF